MSNYKLFQDKAPGIMAKLIADFGLSVDQAAAILGNIGHECAGFTLLQEQNPTSGRGGWGWCQWTGPRRRAFEAWVAERGLAPASDEANYGYLHQELSGSEAGAIAALRKTATLDEGVRVFEANFERAGVKAYPSRERYAALAREAYLAHVPGSQTDGTTAQPPPVDTSGDLAFGMQSTSVQSLQKALTEKGYALGKQDGIFGRLTREAVLAFQADAELPTTGIVDEATRRALETAPPRPLARDRLDATVQDLLNLGSTTIANGLNTKYAGWITGILGVLGLATSGTNYVANTAANAAATTPPVGSTGGSAAATIPSAAKEVITQFTTDAGRVLSTVRDILDPKIYKTVTARIDQVIAAGKQVTTTIGEVAADHAPKNLGPVLNAILDVGATVLPGPIGAVAAIGLGIASHIFGNRVIRSRLADHRDASNVGR